MARAPQRCGTRAKRIACLLRSTHPVQAFFIIRKREEFFFQAKVLFTGFG